VFLQLEQLRNCHSEAAVKSRLKTLPIGLSNTYHEIYREIEELEEHDLEMANRAFMWVMYAREPLSSEELLCAIRVKPEQGELQLSDAIREDTVLSLCRNLLVIDPKRHVWRVSHLSVIEYFENNHHWTLAEAHLYVSQVCLLVLLEPSGFDDSQAIEVTKSSDQVDIIQDLARRFSAYASLHWNAHVRASEE
jgi:ankyrin repeat domain-containing protein 50